MKPTEYYATIKYPVFSKLNESEKETEECKGDLSWDPVGEISCEFEGIVGKEISCSRKYKDYQNRIHF